MENRSAINIISKGSRPSKQGGLFSLNLGQNNGPYLTKDIMITNQKSLNLLQGKDQVAINTSNILAATGQNILSGNQFYSKNALELEEPMDYYDESLKAYTNYDEKYKAKLNSAENLNSNSSFIYENLYADKNENYKLQRELEQLNREKLQIQQQILFSHKRILELEKIVGVQQTNNDNTKNQTSKKNSHEVEEDEEISDFDN